MFSHLLFLGPCASLTQYLARILSDTPNTWEVSKASVMSVPWGQVSQSFRISGNAHYGSQSYRSLLIQLLSLSLNMVEKTENR